MKSREKVRMHEYANLSFKSAPEKRVAPPLVVFSISTPYLHYNDLKDLMGKNQAFPPFSPRPGSAKFNRKVPQPNETHL